MAINFPNNPINGNTYTYNNIVYTFLRPTTGEGYWAVLTPSSVGVATSDEIDEGTNNVKYVAPASLVGSKYVREDQTSGETVLNANGVERLKTTDQGTESTGQMLLNGSKVYNNAIAEVDTANGVLDTARIHYLRVGNLVFRRFNCNSAHTVYNDVIVGDIPVGFRPLTNNTFQGMEFSGAVISPTGARLILRPNEDTIVSWGWQVNQAPRFTASWLTRDV